MKQSHNYDHSHAHTTKDVSNIKYTFYLNFCFAILEVIIGIFANSIALTSNAIHDFGDAIILLFTFNIEKFSFKQRDEQFTYGYRRFTLVGVILNSFILIGGAIIIIHGALHRIINPEPINEYLLFVFAILGIIVNLIGVYKIAKGNDIVDKVLYKNLLYDAINWIVLLIGSIIILITNFYLIDALLSLIISLIMIISVVKGLKGIFYQLMQAVPQDIELKKIDDIIMVDKNILEYHDLHIWNLDGEDYIATFHLVVKDNLTDEQLMKIKEEVKIRLETCKINHATIEIDTKAQAILNNELQ